MNNEDEDVNEGVIDDSVMFTTEQELEQALFNVVMSMWKLKADKTQSKERASAFVIEVLKRMTKAFENQLQS